MILNQAKQKLGSIGWYYQATMSKRLYISQPMSSLRSLKIGHKNLIIYFEPLLSMQNLIHENYFSKRSLKKIASYYFNLQKKNRKFIDNLRQRLNRDILPSYFRLAKKINREDLHNLSNNKLLRDFNNFSRAYLPIWHNLIFLDSYDYYGEILLEKVMAEEKIKIEAKDLAILLSPAEESFLQKQRINLLNFALRLEKIHRSVKVKNLKYGQAMKNPDIKKFILKHTQDYNWINNDFVACDNLKPKYFYGKLVILLRNKQEMQAEISMKKELDKIKKQRAKIFEKYDLPVDFINLAHYFSVLQNLRDLRKSCNQMANGVLRKFVLEFSKRIKIDTALIENMFFWEFKNILTLKTEFKKKLRERQGSSFYIIKSEATYEEFKDKPAEELNSFIKKLIFGKDLKGKTAFPGIVRGKVKLIKGKQDFHKLKKGDILLTANTRPEFVPIMKIAGAIITDEGGITSHAAIVSRELKIPCIVGMQGATAKLKPGQMVEVDANKGIVKIIK